MAGSWDEVYPTVENLLPATIDAVAARTVASRCFVELVYRECEINALWSLADIGLSEGGRYSAPRRGDDPVDRPQVLDRPQLLGQLRLLFEQAYRHLAREHTAEASETLRRAAALAEGRAR